MIAMFQTPNPDPRMVSISGMVLGGSTNHPIYVALWTASGFLEKPAQQIRIEPRAARVFHFRIPEGLWALSAFEDENDNGVLDMGLFRPKEPSGFWRPFHGWRKPRFADVAALIDRDITSADIRLSK